jgi:hypothetical protein
MAVTNDPLKDVGEWREALKRILKEYEMMMVQTHTKGDNS